MDRKNYENSRYAFRRQGQQSHNNQQQQPQQQQQHQSSSSSSSSLNFDRNSSNSSTSSAYSSASSSSSMSHDELIRFIREAWNKVSEQGTPVIHCNESDNQLKNFKPFNLEEFWGQRLVQNIHISQGHQ